MISPVTRRLLRDWKRLWHQGHGKYNVRPQDSNLHLWNFVLTSEVVEIYGVYFFGGSDTEPMIVMRCFTPNGCFPANKNVNLTHLAPILLSQGLPGFLDHIYWMLNHTANLGDLRYMLSWNRVMIKDFKVHFPELHASFILQPEDIALVEQWNESNTNNRREVSKIPNFKIKDLSPLSNTIACDNDDQGKDTKRRKAGNGGMLATHNDTDYNDHTELHRKRRK
ncbi:LANO_0E07580g1_1 [Lachancea nothofagi CBS 11611]|uniref:LANO_0E07580g1_1 n=1 Tax=Lachancea nothofagi CBS 11611 TaxID=1266666 RepID=A0A1G4JUU8_9SACH|nr:LANO_0E07580g1_1 [Lachancea nothofagi CBS 11611]